MADAIEKRASYSFAAAVLLVALSLRLIPVLLTSQLGIGLDDMFQYDMLARSLAAGSGFRWYAPTDLARLAPYLGLDVSKLSIDPRGMRTTFRAPLYPCFISLIYAAFGVGTERFFIVRLIQAFIGALLAPMTYFTALRILGGCDGGSFARCEWGARAAAWIVAAYPMLVIFPLGLATENLFFPLVLGSALVLLKLGDCVMPEGTGQASRLRILSYAALAGLLLGLAALTRSVILLFAVLAVAWMAFTLRQRRAAGVMAAVLGLTLAPWILRNSMLAGKATGIETSMGYNLYVGYHPESTGTFTFGPSLDLLSILDDRARDEIGTQRAIEFIREDPARFPYLALRRLGYFFNLDLRAFTYFYANGFLGYIPAPALILILVILGAPFALVSLSAVIGAAILPRRPQTGLLAILFCSYLLPHIFILSEERFHLAMMPFFAICAADGWLYGRKLLISRKWLVGAAVFVCALLLLNWSLELARDGQTLLNMLGPRGNQLNLPY